jgi:hypothetical protein
MAASAQVMQSLVSGGVLVGEFAQVPLPLADLIEQLLQRGEAA